MTRKPDYYDMPDTYWQDYFEMSPEEKKEIAERYRTFVEECADVCGLDTGKWDMRDYWDFIDRLESVSIL